MESRQEIGPFQFRDRAGKELGQLKKGMHLPGHDLKEEQELTGSLDGPAGVRDSLPRTWEKDRSERRLKVSGDARKMFRKGGQGRTPCCHVGIYL